MRFLPSCLIQEKASCIVALHVLKSFAVKHIHDIWRKNLRWRRKEEFLVFPASYLVVVPEDAYSVTVACFDFPLNALVGSKKICKISAHSPFSSWACPWEEELVCSAHPLGYVRSITAFPGCRQSASQGFN